MLDPAPSPLRALAGCQACPVLPRHIEGPVDEAGLAQLAAALSRRTYRTGQTLFIEGHAAQHLFFIRSGTLRLARTQPDGAEVLLNFVGPGGAVGVESLFGAEHSATATAHGNVQCCTIAPARLRELLPDQPGIFLALLRILGQDLASLRNRVVDLGARPAEQRVARFLVEILPGWTEDAGGFTQVDMARSLGLAPETVSRVLAGFRSQHWVSGQGRKLRVMDPEALTQVAGASRTG